MRRQIFPALVFLLIGCMQSLAVMPNEMLADPALEARARALSAELRCLVCQNESIDESHADLARDLRLLIRERISKGESNEQVRAFLVSRYGDFILLKPPFNLQTLLLWLSAPLTLLLGIWTLFLSARRNKDKTVPLSEEEEALIRSFRAHAPSDNTPRKET
jgi:cytochrome c-type biogenesis protein CcmH